MGLRNFFRAGRGRSLPGIAEPAGRPARTQTPAWVPAGGSFRLGSYAVPGGLVFFGNAHSGPGGWDHEPALIDPALEVDWSRPDRGGVTMDYWPFYSSITPQSRAAYIEWLAGGRSDPQVAIGYVFLFFYGLERRVLVDVGLDPTHPDVLAATAEVRRLLGVYRDNHSFRSYASSFLDFVEVGELVRGQLAPPDPDRLEQTWEVPLSVRVGLGRFVAAGAPIPANWALAWLRTDPLAYLRTAAERCAKEFDELFRLRYTERYGDGAVITPTAKRIEVAYRPASASLGGYVEADLAGLPDVTLSDAAIGPLRELARECADDLAVYSRYLGRDPEGRGTAPAVGLLPAALLRSHGGDLVAQLGGWTASVLRDHTYALVGVDELVDSWWSGREDKLTKADAVTLATLLDKLGVGMAPDVRFGGSKPKPGGSVVLFRLIQGAPAAPSDGYRSASLLVRLAGLLAAADGTISEQEHRQLAIHLESTLGLDHAERVRLGAELEWVGAQEQSLSGLKRRLEALAVHEREVLGQFLVGVAVADGQVTPDEITMLTKLYRLLDLEEADVYRAVHAFEAGDAGPVTAGLRTLMREVERCLPSLSFPVRLRRCA